jgi:amino acid permease
MEIEGVAQPNTKNQESVTLSNNEGNAQKVVNDAQNGENQVNGVLIYQTDSEKDLIQVKKSENEENQNENKESNETSCFKKFTSHFEEGTMVNSIFNMSIVSLGTGVFAIPVKVQYMTLVFTSIYVILAGIANLISLFMISYAVDKTGILDFFQITYKILGKICGTILSIVMIVYCYGLVILFQIIIYKLVGGIVNDIGNYNYESLNDFVDNSFWKKYLYKFTICYGINLLLIMPFCLRKNIGEMKISTYVGVISLIFVILIIIIQSPFFIDHYYDEIYKKDDKSTHLNIYDLSKGVDKDLNIIRPFVTLFFAYTSQIALFPIISAVKDRTKKRVNKIFYISSFIDGGIYIVIGILGYLTQPINTPDLIIERKSIFKKDYFMIIGRILLTLTLLGKIAPFYNSMRTTLFSTIGIDINNYSTLLNCAITIPLILISTLVGVLYQKIGDYIDFLGSFCSIFICFAFPGMMYIKTNDYHKYHWKNILTVIYIVVFTILCCISGGYTVRDIVRNSK